MNMCFRVSKHVVKRNLAVIAVEVVVSGHCY